MDNRGFKNSNRDEIYQANTPMPDKILAKRRNCTDILCLLIFILFVLAQIGVSVFAYMNGDPKQLVTPRDSTGRLCTNTKKNLFFFNLLQCINVNALLTGCSTPQICVEECPNKDLYYMIPEHMSILLKNYCKQDELLALYGNTIPNTLTIQEYTDLYSKNICPLYSLSSKPLFQRCLPSIINDVTNIIRNITVTDDSNTTSLNIFDNSTNQIVTDKSIKSAVDYITKLLNIKTIGQFVLEDFYNSAVLLCVLLLIGAFASFIYIVITRWIVGPMIWFSLIGIVALLSFAVYFCIDRYINLKNNTESQQAFQFKLDFNYYLQLSTTWLVIGIIGGVILLIILLLILVLIKRLRLAIGLIKEGSKAVTGLFFVILWPTIPFILQIGLLGYNISVAVYLASAGKELYRVTNSTPYCCSNATFKIGDPCNPTTFNNQSQNATCVFYRYGYGNPLSTTETTAIINFLNDYQWLPQIYNLFMFFWFQAFITGFNQMVLAGCFAIWYWSKSKKFCIACTSLKDTLLYHLGSIAFGALLISIVKLIRAIIQFVENRIKAATGNNASTNFCITFVSCCCRCCFWCLEKFLKFLNRNAYIMIAIYGKNFCSSAHDAFILLASNPLRALVLDRVTDFILFLGKILITAGVSVLAFYFFAKKFYIDPNWAKYFAPDLHYYWLPLIIVIIGTYFIAKIFFTVFEMAVDTIFLCAMKDLNVNDGSTQKPYFMSKELRKLLHVKNVEPAVRATLRKKASVNPANNHGKPSAPQDTYSAPNYYQYHETFNNYN